MGFLPEVEDFSLILLVDCLLEVEEFDRIVFSIEKRGTLAAV
ncbi:hypothetical protein [Tychonema sp. LEGE 07203]|nr:hypothetical protein [Tychonema sp. LEGE 07203]